jgi:hypothetical protein
MQLIGDDMARQRNISPLMPPLFTKYDVHRAHFCRENTRHDGRIALRHATGPGCIRGADDRHAARARVQKRAGDGDAALRSQLGKTGAEAGPVLFLNRSAGEPAGAGPPDEEENLLAGMKHRCRVFHACQTKQARRM